MYFCHTLYSCHMVNLLEYVKGLIVEQGFFFFFFSFIYIYICVHYHHQSLLKVWIPLSLISVCPYWSTLEVSLAQSSGAVQYTDCIPAEGRRFCTNNCPGYDTKQSDGKDTVKLELWGMRCIPSLPLLPGPLWPGVVAPDRVLSMGPIKLNYVLILNWIVWIRTVWLNWIAWNGNVFDNLNCVFMLNWIVRNRTVHLYKKGFGIK